MLFDTTDYRRFLLQALERLGKTQRDLAKDVGRTSGWLSLVLSRQRSLDPNLVADLGRSLELSEAEANYFAALVDLESRSPRARRTAWATVQATQRHHREAELHADVAHAFSHWYVQAIAELAACEGFRADPAWLADTLNPPITVQQAEDAVATLLRLGMLVPDEDGGLRQGKDLHWSPTDLPAGEISRAVTRAHMETLGIAQHALQTLWQNERHVSGTTMALTEAQYPQLVSRLHELERELVLMVEGPREEAPNRVYHLGITLVPVTGYTDSEGDDQPQT